MDMVTTNLLDSTMVSICREDIREGYVSAERAAADYGSVASEEN